jgi:hypothetical protein
MSTEVLHLKHSLSSDDARALLERAEMQCRMAGMHTRLTLRITEGLHGMLLASLTNEEVNDRTQSVVDCALLLIAGDELATAHNSSEEASAEVLNTIVQSLLTTYTTQEVY